MMADAVLAWDERYPRQTAHVAEGIALSYIDVGPRDGLPVVLVHGWPDLAFGWRHQIEPLAERHRVIVPDLRGYGRSAKPTTVEQYGAKNITSDLAALLDVLAIDAAVFIGHDWGGSIVWRMCLYQPTRVRAVCGICTPYFPPSPTLIDVDAFVAAAPQFAYMKLLSQVETTATLFEQVPRKVLTFIFGQASAASVAQSKPVSVVDVLSDIVNVELPADLQLPLTQAELDYYVKEYTASGFLPSLHWYATRPIDYATERGLPIVIPHTALYIGAAQDPVLKPALAAHMPKLMPNLQMTVIDDAGHWILWEKPTKVTTTLLDWLATSVLTHHP